MSEILITGIEMPKKGEVLYLAITSGGVVGRSEKALNYIPQNAKAVELPPHGDLKDVDEIITEFESWYCDENRYDFIRELEMAPTWISASKGDK